jgi:hypothetical protein
VDLPQIALLPPICQQTEAIDPRFDEEERWFHAMKRAPSDEPNLEDILERDFSELKVGEDNITPDEEAPAAEPQENEHASKPSIIYNQRIDAVEDRETFAVKPPKPVTQTNPEEAQAPAPKVLKEPTTQLGDDFDVNW